MSFMSATVAMVVPSLKLFAWMTELPTFTGTSNIMPSMVLRICVVLVTFEFFEMPSRTISNSLCAVLRSSTALS